MLSALNVTNVECGTFGEGSLILANQTRESTVFSILFGQNLRPFPEDTVPYVLGNVLYGLDILAEEIYKA